MANLVNHTSSQAPQSFENFDLIKQIKLDFTDVVISKWQSRVTGLSVVHLDYEGKSERLPGWATIAN
jgi:hypothetical protein